MTVLSLLPPAQYQAWQFLFEIQRTVSVPWAMRPAAYSSPNGDWNWRASVQKASGTKLRGPAKGIFYQLYVLIDSYSWFNPSWICRRLV
jgi:putative transposase